MTRTALQHNAPANDPISYAGYRFPPDVISYAVWLYYRFPLSLRMVEELLGFCRNKDGWASKGAMISNAYWANE